ncbi:MAG TPA: hypothetical protein VMU51_26415 [Mycobacteriales bacterium]|nr:hypothetical protein [Mycobacteriales bacterium]
MLGELTGRQLNDLWFWMTDDELLAAGPLVDGEASGRRAALQRLLEGGSPWWWWQLEYTFRRAAHTAMVRVVAELRDGQRGGRLPDLAEMYARGIERPNLRNTPFGEVVPQLLALALRQPITVLEPGRPAQRHGRDADGPPLYLLRIPGEGSPRYAALEVPGRLFADARVFDVLPSQAQIDDGAGRWSADALSEVVRWDDSGRSVWFAGADVQTAARFGVEARRFTVGHDEIALHLEGRGGRAYLDGRHVPVAELAAVVAGLPVGFSRVWLLICEAGRGELTGLAAELAARGRPGIGVHLADDQVGITAWGVAVAVTSFVDRDGRLRAAQSSFRESPESGTLVRTYPPTADLAADPGPLALRMGKKKNRARPAAAGAVPAAAVAGPSAAGPASVAGGSGSAAAGAQSELPPWRRESFDLLVGQLAYRFAPWIVEHVVRGHRRRSGELTGLHVWPSDRSPFTVIETLAEVGGIKQVRWGPASEDDSQVTKVSSLFPPGSTTRELLRSALQAFEYARNTAGGMADRRWSGYDHSGRLISGYLHYVAGGRTVISSFWPELVEPSAELTVEHRPALESAPVPAPAPVVGSTVDPYSALLERIRTEWAAEPSADDQPATARAELLAGVGAEAVALAADGRLPADGLTRWLAEVAEAVGAAGGRDRRVELLRSDVLFAGSVRSGLTEEAVAARVAVLGAAAASVETGSLPVEDGLSRLAELLDAVEGTARLADWSPEVLGVQEALAAAGYRRQLAVSDLALAGYRGERGEISDPEQARALEKALEGRIAALDGPGVALLAAAAPGVAATDLQTELFAAVRDIELLIARLPADRPDPDAPEGRDQRGRQYLLRAWIHLIQTDLLAVTSPRPYPDLLIAARLDALRRPARSLLAAGKLELGEYVERAGRHLDGLPAARRAGFDLLVSDVRWAAAVAGDRGLTPVAVLDRVHALIGAVLGGQLPAEDFDVAAEAVLRWLAADTGLAGKLSHHVGILFSDARQRQPVPAGGGIAWLTARLQALTGHGLPLVFDAESAEWLKAKLNELPESAARHAGFTDWIALLRSDAEMAGTRAREVSYEQLHRRIMVLASSGGDVTAVGHITHDEFAARVAAAGSLLRLQQDRKLETPWRILDADRRRSGRDPSEDGFVGVNKVVIMIHRIFFTLELMRAGLPVRNELVTRIRDAVSELHRFDVDDGSDFGEFTEFNEFGEATGAGVDDRVAWSVDSSDSESGAATVPETGHEPAPSVDSSDREPGGAMVPGEATAPESDDEPLTIDGETFRTYQDIIELSRVHAPLAGRGEDGAGEDELYAAYEYLRTHGSRVIGRLSAEHLVHVFPMLQDVTELAAKLEPPADDFDIVLDGVRETAIALLGVVSPANSAPAIYIGQVNTNLSTLLGPGAQLLRSGKLGRRRFEALFRAHVDAATEAGVEERHFAGRTHLMQSDAAYYAPTGQQRLRVRRRVMALQGARQFTEPDPQTGVVDLDMLELIEVRARELRAEPGNSEFDAELDGLLEELRGRALPRAAPPDAPGVNPELHNEDPAPALAGLVRHLEPALRLTTGHDGGVLTIQQLESMIKPQVPKATQRALRQLFTHTQRLAAFDPAHTGGHGTGGGLGDAPPVTVLPLEDWLGFVFPGPREDVASAAVAGSTLPLSRNVYVVAGHISADGQRLVVSDGRELTPERAADEITASVGYVDGTPVVLVACRAASVGATGRSFAARLSAAMGTDVLAADMDVWQLTDRRVIATRSGFTADGVPQPEFGPKGRGRGQWLLHSAPAGDGTAVSAPKRLGADLVSALATARVVPAQGGRGQASWTRPAGQLDAPYRWGVNASARRAGASRRSGVGPGPSDLPGADSGPTYRTGSARDPSEAPGRFLPSEQQLERLTRLGLIPVPAEAGGNCFFESLLSVAADEVAERINAFATDLSVAEGLRDGLHSVTAEELRTPTLETIGLVRRVMSRLFRVDYREHQAWYDAMLWTPEVPGAPVRPDPQGFADQIATFGLWDTAYGDRWTQLAARLFRVSLRLINDDGSVQSLGDVPGRRERFVIRVNFPAGVAHYLATRPYADATDLITEHTPLPAAMGTFRQLVQGFHGLQTRMATRGIQPPAELRVLHNHVQDLIAYVRADPALTASTRGEPSSEDARRRLLLQLAATVDLHEQFAGRLVAWEGTIRPPSPQLPQAPEPAPASAGEAEQRGGVAPAPALPAPPVPVAAVAQLGDLLTTPAGNPISQLDGTTYEVQLPGAAALTPRILISAGDLFEQPTEAIVDLAVDSLQGGGPLSRSIAEQGGRAYLSHREWQIDTAIESALRERSASGRVVGDAITTPSFDIARSGARTITHVIHALAPNVRRPDQRDPRLLHDAVSNALREADANYLGSVSIPQSPATGMPDELVARHTMRALLDTPTGVGEVRLVLPGATRQQALEFADRLLAGANEPRPREPGATDLASTREEEQESADQATQRPLAASRPPLTPLDVAGLPGRGPATPTSPTSLKQPSPVARPTRRAVRFSELDERSAEAARRRVEPAEPVGQDRRGVADEADAGAVFAPPAYTVHGTVGPHTSEPVDARLLTAVRTMVLAQIPGRLHVEVTPTLDSLLNEQTFDAGFRQAVADRLEIVLPTSTGAYVAGVALVLGDWAQVTDPRGRVLDLDRHGNLRRQPGKSEIRVRQVDEFADPVGSSRDYAVNAGLTFGVNPSHGVVGRDPLTSANGTVTEVAPLLDASRGRAATTGVSTARYVKGSSYRAVDFLYDVAAVVSVWKPGAADTGQASLLRGALLVRYAREATRRIRRPDGMTTGIDSAGWSRLTGTAETSTEEIVQRYEELQAARSGTAGAEPEAPFRPPSLEGAIELVEQPEPGVIDIGPVQPQQAPPEDGSPVSAGWATEDNGAEPDRRSSSSEIAEAPPADRGLLGRLRRGRGLPAGGRLPQRGDPQAVPRTSWVEAVTDADAFRQAVFGVLDPALTVPGSESYQALSAFTSVNTLHGGLHRMQFGVLSPVLFARDSLGRLHRDVVLVTAELLDGELDREHQYDDFTRVDTEDVYLSSGGAPVTLTDALNTRGALGVALAKGPKFAAGLSEALGWRRAVSQTRPGPFAGAVQLFKWKFTGEPQSQSAHPVIYRAYSVATGRRQTAQGGAVIRWLWRDAASHPTLADQFDRNPAPQRPPAQPWLPAVRDMHERHEREIAEDRETAERNRRRAAALGPEGQRWAAEQLAAREAARRRDPHRMLLMPETYGGWLPAFSRVSRWGDDVNRVLERTVELILGAFPAYLPGIGLAGEAVAPGQSRLRFGPEWTEGFGNLLALWGALSPEELAGRLHKMVGGGDEIVLRAPRRLAGTEFADRHLVLRLKATFDRREFRYRRSLAGQMEVYYGNSWDLVGSTSRSNSWTVDPLNISFTRNFVATTVGVRGITPSLQPRLSWSHTRTEAAGFGAGGAIGGGSDWMAEFDGAVTFDISLEEVRPHRETPRIPGGFPDLEAGPPQPDADQPGRSAVRSTTVRVPTSVLVTEDLAHEVVAPAAGDPPWNSLGYLESLPLQQIPTGMLYRLPHRSTLGDLAGGQPWTPDPTSGTLAERVPPQGALYVVDTSGVLRHITAALAQLGVQSLSAQERIDLLAQVNSLGQRFRDHVNLPRQLWRTRLAWGPRSSTMVEIRVRARLNRIDPIGETDHAYRYLHAAATAQLRRSWATDKIAPSIGLNVPVPVTTNVGGTDVVTPLSFSARLNWSNPRTSQQQTAGTADRVEIDIGRQFWGDLHVEWELEVRLWDGSDPSIPWLAPAEVADPTVQRALSTVAARGLVLMPRHHAVDRGLVASTGHNGAPDPRSYPGAASSRGWEVLAQSTKGGDPWALQRRPEELRPGFRLPPVNALRDGFGHGVVLATPELGELHEAVMTTVHAGYSAELAAAIEGELGKITTLAGTRGLLEDMLGGITVLIPHHQLGVGWLVRMSIRAAVLNPQYAGPKPSPSVVERKNVAAQAHQVDRGASTSMNLTGQASYARNVTLDPDPANRPDPGTLNELDVSAGATGSRTSGHSQSARTEYQESFGLLSITEPERIRLDVEFTVEFEHVWAPLGVLNLASLTLLRGYGALPPVVRMQRGSLLLGFPIQLTRLDPRAAVAEIDDSDDAPTPGGTLKARTVVRRALRAVQAGLDPHPLRRTEYPLIPETLEPGVGLDTVRRGIRLGPTSESEVDLRAEVDLESVAELPRLRAAAKTLLGGSGPVSAILTRLFGDRYRQDPSWQGSTFRQQHRIDTALTHSYLIRNVLSMLHGDGHTVPIPRDGWLWDADGELSIAVDILQVDPIDYDPRTGVTLDQTLTKDFERHATGTGYTRNFSHAVNPAVTVTPRLRDNVESLPTLPSGQLDTRTLGTVGVPFTLSGSRTIGTSSTVTAPRAQLERGDKTTGRDYTRLAANRVIWWFSYRPAMDQPATVVGVQIDDEAVLLWAPRGQVSEILDRLDDIRERPGAPRAYPEVSAPEASLPEMPVDSTPVPSRPPSFVGRRGSLPPPTDRNAALLSQIKDLDATFKEAQESRAPEDDEPEEFPEEIRRERFLLDAVSEAREAGAEEVDRIAEPVVRARTRLNRAAQRLAALRFDDLQRLNALTTEQLTDLADRLRTLDQAATRLTNDLAAVERRLRRTPAPEPIRQNIAQLRQELATLDQQQRTRGESRTYLRRALVGAVVAGIGLRDLHTELDDAAERANDAADEGATAREATESPDRVDVWSAHEHGPVLREEVDALRHLDAEITRLTGELTNALEPHRADLVRAMAEFERAIQTGRSSAEQARLTWLREWAGAAALDEGRAAREILARLAETEANLQGAGDLRGGLPEVGLAEQDLVQLASDYEGMRDAAAAFLAQRDALDAAEQDLSREHPGLRPPTEQEADRLRIQLVDLQRTVERFDGQWNRTVERSVDAQRWLTTAERAGTDVTGHQIQLAAAKRRRGATQLRAGESVSRAGTQASRYTLRQMAAVHAALSDRVAAEQDVERIVDNILRLVPQMSTPSALQERILNLRAEYARQIGAEGPEATARNLRALLRRHDADPQVAAILRDLEAERASHALPRPSRAATGRDPARLRLRAATNAEESLLAAVDARNAHGQVVRDLVERARIVLGADALGQLAGPPAEGEAPARHTILVADYELVSAEGAPEPAFRRHEELHVLQFDAEAGEPSAFPADRPVQRMRLDQRPFLEVSSDGTLAISAQHGAQEFYATEAVVARANTALRQANSRVTLEMQPEHRITLDVGTGPRSLVRVVPRFAGGLPSDVCRDFAAAVMGGMPNLAVFRSPDDQQRVTATGGVNAGGPVEITGMQYLARAMAAAIDADEPRLDDVDPHWAARAVGRDPRTGGTGAAVLAGEQYGSALNRRPGNERRRRQMRAVSDSIGVNEAAWPDVGEAYATSTVLSGVEGGADYTNYARDIEMDPEQIWGYDLAAVALQSEDGQVAATISNYGRAPERERGLSDAIDRTLERYRERLAEVRDHLVAADRTDRRVELINMLLRIQDLRTQHPASELVIADPAAARPLDRIDPASVHADLMRQTAGLMEQILLPPASETWQVSMFSRAQGDTFHDSRGNLDPNDEVPFYVNPLTVVLAAGATAEPRPVVFLEQSASLDGMETARRVIARTAVDYERQAAWQTREGFPPPTVSIVGHGPRALARSRADAVAQELRVQIGTVLAGLGTDAPTGLTADDVDIQIGVAADHGAQTRTSRRNIVEITIARPNQPAARQAASLHYLHGWRPELEAVAGSFRSALANLLSEQPTLAVDETDIQARIEGLTAIAPGLNDYTDTVFSVDRRRRLGTVAMRLSGLDAPPRTRLLSALHDLITSSSLRPTQTADDGHRTVQVVPLDVLDRALVHIRHDLDAGRDPFVGVLAHLGYEPTQPLAERLARLSLLNLTPDARAALMQRPVDRVFASPLLPLMMLAVNGTDGRQYLNTGGAAAINQNVRSRAATIPALLLTGRSLADQIERQLDDMVSARHPALGEPDRPGRTLRDLVRDAVAEARREFNRIESGMVSLLDDAPRLQTTARWRSLARLVSQWDDAMQGLSTVVDPTNGISGIPIATPLRFRPPLMGGTSGRAARRQLDVDVETYAERLGRLFIRWPELGGTIVAETLEAHARVEPVAVARFWERAQAAGGIVVGTVRGPVFLSAVMREGERVFALDDPASDRRYLPADQLIDWATLNEAVASGDYLPPVPVLDGPLLPSSLRIDPTGEPWSAADLQQRARLVENASGGYSVWFERNADVHRRTAAEAALGRPARGEVWVHLEGHNGVVYLDGRPVPPAVLAAVLVAQSVASGEQLEFDRVMLLICEAGRGTFVAGLRAALADEHGRQGVRLWATRDVAAVSRTTGTTVAVQVAADRYGRPYAMTRGRFEETSEEGQAAVGWTVPPDADVRRDAGPFKQRLLQGHRLNALDLPVWEPMPERPVQPPVGWAKPAAHDGPLKSDDPRPATDPGARRVAGPLSTLAEAYGVPLVHAGAPVQVDLPPVDVAADTAQLLRVPDYEAIVLDLIFAGAGARGLAVVRDSADAGPGRELTVVYDGTGVVFLDRRTGGLGELPAAPAELLWTLTGNGT